MLGLYGGFPRRRWSIPPSSSSLSTTLPFREERSRPRPRSFSLSLSESFELDESEPRSSANLAVASSEPSRFFLGRSSAPSLERRGRLDLVGVPTALRLVGDWLLLVTGDGARRGSFGPRSPGNRCESAAGPESPGSRIVCLPYTDAMAEGRVLVSSDIFRLCAKVSAVSTGGFGDVICAAEDLSAVLDLCGDGGPATAELLRPPLLDGRASLLARGSGAMSLPDNLRLAKLLRCSSSAISSFASSIKAFPRPSDILGDRLCGRFCQKCYIRQCIFPIDQAASKVVRAGCCCRTSGRSLANDQRVMVVWMCKMWSAVRCS